MHWGCSGQRAPPRWVWGEFRKEERRRAPCRQRTQPMRTNREQRRPTVQYQYLRSPLPKEAPRPRTGPRGRRCRREPHLRRLRLGSWTQQGCREGKERGFAQEGRPGRPSRRWWRRPLGSQIPRWGGVSVLLTSGVAKAAAGTSPHASTAASPKRRSDPDRFPFIVGLLLSLT